MNTFIVRLKCDLNEDIVRFFKNRGTIITHFDKILSDMLIVETNLSKEEMNKLEYVYSANEPRIGSLMMNISN